MKKNLELWRISKVLRAKLGKKRKERQNRR